MQSNTPNFLQRIWRKTYAVISQALRNYLQARLEVTSVIVICKGTAVEGDGVVGELGVGAALRDQNKEYYNHTPAHPWQMPTGIRHSTFAT